MTDRYDCVISIVVYQTPGDMIQRAIQSCLKSSLALKIYVVDNSPTPSLKESLAGWTVSYHFAGRNLGFGKAHNWAIGRRDPSDYHLVLNPDVFFEKGTLEALKAYMDQNPDIGVVTPKVLYPDGRVQCSCREFPTPFLLFGRRFFPEFVRKKLKHYFDRYELNGRDPDQSANVPWLSGCFMFARSEILRKMGGFDDRFFMYMEDVDLCRRIGQTFRVAYFPGAEVFHEWKRASHKSLKPLMIHVLSALRYFNKWGWLNRTRSV